MDSTSKNIYQGDGNNIKTPLENTTENIVPIVYDKVANNLKTKDEQGNIIDINPSSGGGGLGWAYKDPMINEVSLGGKASTTLRSIFALELSTPENFDLNIVNGFTILASNVATESTITNDNPTAVTASYENTTQGLRGIRLTKLVNNETAIINWTWNGINFQLNVTT
jgi:hypothetical protein